MLRESRFGRRYLQWIEQVPVRLLSRLAVKPDHISFVGLGLSLLAIPMYGYSLWMRGVIILFSGAVDTLDGSLARKTNQPSPSGAFLDSVLDRYSDFFAVFGIWLFYIFHPGNEFPLLITALLFLYLAGSFLVSYSRARGEGLGVSVTLGFFGRAERVVLLGTGSLLADLLAFIFSSQSWATNRLLLITLLILLTIGTHLTALQRILFLYKNLKKPDLP